MAAGEVMVGNAGANIEGQDNNLKFEDGKSKSAAESGAAGHEGMASSQSKSLDGKSNKNEPSGDLLSGVLGGATGGGSKWMLSQKTIKSD